MGRIALVLDFSRVSDEHGFASEVKCDMGGGDTVTAEVFLPPGSDEHPLPGDYAFLLEGPGSGNWIAIGFVDPALSPITESPGEKALFSRSAPGTIASAIVMKADGTAELSLAGGAKKVQFTLDGDVVADGKSAKTHSHSAGMLAAPSGGGTVTGTTGAPT